MPRFPEYRRSAPSIRQIRHGMGASHRQVCQLENRCRDAGMKMTNLRRVILHGILEAGNGATAIDIRLALLGMMEGHVPSPTSLQRTLNMMVALGVLGRQVGIDRIWHYDLPPARHTSSPVIVIDAGTGAVTPCNDPEMTILLARFAARHGLAIQEATLTVTTLGEPLKPARSR